MTKPTDYSDWTYGDHLVVAGELAARADAAAETTLAPSQAAQQRESILQTCARGQLHAKLAELKKPQPAAAEPAPRQTRQRAEKNPDS